jgi:tetratricopeptide (TPR) repeat protein
MLRLETVYREDYLMRHIQQLVAFVAHISGLNQQGEHDKALEAMEQAWGKLLEAPHELIDSIDTPTLAGMLREPAKIRAAAQLLVEEGRALVGKGDPQRAAARFRRAMELLFEARALEPNKPTRDDDAALQELSDVVPAETLDPRYRAGA